MNGEDSKEVDHFKYMVVNVCPDGCASNELKTRIATSTGKIFDKKELMSDLRIDWAEML